MKDKFVTSYKAQGLYNPIHEHDSCGIGFVAHIKGHANHNIIEQGLKILENLTHRGAVSSDVLMGDGAGILLQIPDKLYREEFAGKNINLPPPGEYGVGMIFLPKEYASRQACVEELERIVRMEGQTIIGWRQVPVKQNMLMSQVARNTAPIIEQLFIGRGRDIMTTDALERKLYIIRKRTAHAICALELQYGKEYFVPSMSARTVIYKGLLLAHQVGEYYPDLQNVRTISNLAVVHQRFSTNTFPSWQLAHPYPMIAHNGEINTIKGNVNWINARTASIKSSVLGEDIHKLWPLICPGQSDTASFDNCLELLTMGGYPLAHAMMMMIPEAYEKYATIDENRAAFYEYHAAMMEPWDGPAAMIFTDGKQVGATLDRNGLRPARFCITRDDLVILSSEAGVLRLDQNQITYKGRLQPGKMFLLDMELGCVIDDKILKNTMANIRPYKSWVNAVRIKLDEIKEEQHCRALAISDAAIYIPQMATFDNDLFKRKLQSFAYRQEELNFLSGFISKRQADTKKTEYFFQKRRLAILAPENRLLFDYFNQLVAQATNPPIDAKYEGLVMSLASFVGPKPNLLDINNINPPMRLETYQPILNAVNMAKIYEIERYSRGKFRAYKLDICYPVKWGKDGIEARLASICAEAVEAVAVSNYNILVLSDRAVSQTLVAIPALLATSAIHQHLACTGLRSNTGLVIETGSARSAHHFALLASYGAEAIYPYLAMEVITTQIKQEPFLARASIELINANDAIQNFICAMSAQIKNIISQIGISTYMSYTGSQMFEAIGISEKVTQKYFHGTSSSIGGLDIFDIASESLAMHEAAFGVATQTIQELQNIIYMPTPVNIRELFTIKTMENNNAQHEAYASCNILLEEASKIIERFSISCDLSKKLKLDFGSYPNSNEQKCIWIAECFHKKTQIISANRSGLTLEALATAELIEIEMADKYATHIAPHHDIYSIEDLAQLIYDLKNVNPTAIVAVKLLSQTGIGTVAVGVAKAKADLIIISGDDACSIGQTQTINPNIGSPWEIGLSEIHQTLSINGLRSKIKLQVAGYFKDGADIIIATLLGAEKFSFTALSEEILTNKFCVESMQDTCQVKNLDDMKNFYTEINNYFLSIAEQVRNYLTQFKVSSLSELIGRSAYLTKTKELNFWKIKTLDFTKLLHQTDLNIDFYSDSNLSLNTNVRIENADCNLLINEVDQQLIRELKQTLKADIAIEPNNGNTKLLIKHTINNSQRSIGAALSGEIVRFNLIKISKQCGNSTQVRKEQPSCIDKDAVLIKNCSNDNYVFQVLLKGTAGQSFGAFLAPNITLELEGDANDYVGKGLAGGLIIVRIAQDFYADATHNIIVGNTVLYGATSGQAFFNGIAGERFAACNFGATAVTEGVGDHACEYMSAGLVVVLGATGENFAAGMKGGVAYVYDEDGTFASRCNLNSVKLNTVVYELDALDTLDGVNSDSKSDTKILFSLLTQHYQYTSSLKAKTILANWALNCANFIKITATI